MVEFYHKFYIYIYIYREREREREAYLNHDIDGYQKKIIHIPKLLYYSYIIKKKKNQRVPRLFSHLKNYRVSNLFKQ